MFNKLVRRLIDIVGAIVGLQLSAPLIAIFGVLVYLGSPGPIFYRQRRLGRNGKPFEVNRLRGDTDLTQRISHDLYYVEHWNLLFDFRVMLLTFFKNENAR